jgi:WD40 repeat protein
VGAPVVRVGWWTDPVGRRHWRVVGRRLEYADYHLKKFAFAAHPLWHVYPDRLALRQDGDFLTLLAHCDCGVAGPVERLAWMGRCCGPCHDRGEDGLSVRRTGPAQLGGHPAIAHLSFAGDALLSGGTDGRIVRWNLEDGIREVLLHRRSSAIQALAATASGLVAANTGPGRILLHWPGATEWQEISLRCGHVGALTISPDERWLAVAGTNCHLVDLKSSDLTARLVLAGRCVGPFCFSADSRTLWALDVSADLHRIDVASGRADLARTRPASEPDSSDEFFLGFGYYPFPRAMASSPDGRWLAVVASWDGWFGTQVADLATGRWFSLRAASAVFANRLAFTAENDLASADSDGLLRIWDVTRQRLRAVLLPASKPASFHVPAFSPDGGRVALGANDAIRLVPWKAMLRG